MKKKLAILSLLMILLAFGFLAFSLTGSMNGLGTVSKIIIDNTIKDTGAINSVTATVFGFRGYDTLGETIVLFTAICGVASVHRKTKKAKGEN